MPLQATSGAASYDAFGGGVAAVPQYIEDVFSSYLWTTSGSNQTLTTGIDMTKGALTWIKGRSNAYSHILQTGIGGGVLPDNALSTNSTAAYAGGNYRIADSTTGFTMGVDYYTGTPETAVVWTFRKQPKFFDVLTYTGNGTAGTAISHSLGSTPGFILVKRTDTGGTTGQNWVVWHRSAGGTGYFNSTNALDSSFPNSIFWGNGSSYVAPTSTTFTVTDSQNVNASGGSYVAYLFAHDAGGFGLTGTDNVISCGSGSWSGGADNVVNLGYEAQWVMYKRTDDVGNWMMWDTMRGMSLTASEYLRANLSDAAGTFNSPYAIYPTATGFTVPAGAVSTGNYIYIAIRRGPMKVPTLGTTVYNAVARTGTGASANITGVGFPTDLVLSLTRNFGGTDHLMVDRLRGSSAQIFTNLSAAESTNATSVTSLASNDGISVGTDYPIQSINYASGYTYVTNFFKRAPSFFDEVCYTGTGSALTVNHNLGVAPEIIIIKRRSSAASNNNWYCGWNMNASTYMEAILNTSDAGTLYNYPNWFTGAPTSTTFAIAGGGNVNANTATYVAYLFATCAGVSKCTSFTGNGSSQTINCGFTGGARFVLIKRVDSTGNWVTFDTARGIVSGNDPALYLNSTAAEVTGVDAIDPDSTGFIVNQESTFNLNVSSATYLVLAIA